MRANATATAFLVLVGLIGCGGTTPDPATGTTEPNEPRTEPEADITEPLVRLYLLADVTSISPGQEFRLAARLDIEPSWHIYWINPGEAGLPTSVQFTTPLGFETKEVAYPGPKSFDGDGGVLSYGYEELVLLSLAATAPDNIDGPQEFKVKGTWLACREMCIPGEAEAVMALPVAGASQPSGPANVEMFDAHARALPVPLSSAQGSPRWLEDQWALEIRLSGAKSAEYFPSTDEQTRLSGQLAIPKEDGVTLVLSYKRDSSLPIAAKGVIRISDGSATTFHQLDWSQTP